MSARNPAHKFLTRAELFEDSPTVKDGGWTLERLKKGRLENREVVRRMVHVLSLYPNAENSAYIYADRIFARCSMSVLERMYLLCIAVFTAAKAYGTHGKVIKLEKVIAAYLELKGELDPSWDDDSDEEDALVAELLPSFLQAERQFMYTLNHHLAPYAISYPLKEYLVSLGLAVSYDEDDVRHTFLQDTTPENKRQFGFLVYSEWIPAIPKTLVHLMYPSTKVIAAVVSHVAQLARLQLPDLDPHEELRLRGLFQHSFLVTDQEQRDIIAEIETAFIVVKKKPNIKKLLNAKPNPSPLNAPSQGSAGVSGPAPPPHRLTDDQNNTYVPEEAGKPA